MCSTLLPESESVTLADTAFGMSELGSWSAGWQAAPDLGKRLEKLIPAADIVEIHSLYLYHTWKASRLAAQHGVPYIVRPHGSLNIRDRRHHLIRKKIYELLIENKTLQFAAGLHCTSVGETMQLPRKDQSTGIHYSSWRRREDSCTPTLG